MVIKEEVLQHFRDMSKKLADQKELIVLQTWHNFFNDVLDEIDKNVEWSRELYKTQREFYLEETSYQKISKTDDTKSCQIKLVLHEILTKAIFNFCPCSDLVHSCKKRNQVLKNGEKILLWGNGCP